MKATGFEPLTLALQGKSFATELLLLPIIYMTFCVFSTPVPMAVAGFVPWNLELKKYEMFLMLINIKNILY
jgi:hypothetical protein